MIGRGGSVGGAVVRKGLHRLGRLQKRERVRGRYVWDVCVVGGVGGRQWRHRLSGLRLGEWCVVPHYTYSLSNSPSILGEVRGALTFVAGRSSSKMTASSGACDQGVCDKEGGAGCLTIDIHYPNNLSNLSEGVPNSLSILGEARRAHRFLLRPETPLCICTIRFVSKFTDSVSVPKWWSPTR